MAGSSPRLRGTDRQRKHIRGKRRFIPAPAGNGESGCGGSSSRPVHPRACGERKHPACARVKRYGSSPRLRGTEDNEGEIKEFARFIPAPAGNGYPGGADGLPCPVHPRACGERNDGVAAPEVVAGSSPRLRGTDSGHSMTARACRFIPAPAGNGRRMPRSWTACSVHPRACGERFHRKKFPSSHHGSSPRLRGTVDPMTGSIAQMRFIPAPAGNGKKATATA